MTHHQNISIQRIDSLVIHVIPGDESTALRGLVAGLGAADLVAAPGASAAPPEPGEKWPGQGGIFVGTVPALHGRPAFHLIAAETEPKSLAWGGYGQDEAESVSHHDGWANTAALLKGGRDHSAAQWAAQHQADGHADFYLPAHAELALAWINAAHIFRTDDWYWSSTQYSSGCAWAQYFKYGNSNGLSKRNTCHVLPFRRLILS